MSFENAESILARRIKRGLLLRGAFELKGRLGKVDHPLAELEVQYDKEEMHFNLVDILHHEDYQ